MTLQERMIAVYLRQAKLPEVEREKLRLFLGLLLETMDEDESDEDPFPAAPAPEAGKTGPAVQDGAAGQAPAAVTPEAPEKRAGTGRGPEHPFVSRILRIMERRELSKLRTAKEIGISDVGLAAILEGRNRPRKDTEDLIERWLIREEQDAGTADTEAG